MDGSQIPEKPEPPPPTSLSAFVSGIAGGVFGGLAQRQDIPLPIVVVLGVLSVLVAAVLITLPQRPGGSSRRWSRWSSSSLLRVALPVLGGIIIGIGIVFSWSHLWRSLASMNSPQPEPTATAAPPVVGLPSMAMPKPVTLSEKPARPMSDLPSRWTWVCTGDLLITYDDGTRLDTRIAPDLAHEPWVGLVIEIGAVPDDRDRFASLASPASHLLTYCQPVDPADPAQLQGVIDSEREALKTNETRYVNVCGKACGDVDKIDIDRTVIGDYDPMIEPMSSGRQGEMDKERHQNAL